MKQVMKKILCCILGERNFNRLNTLRVDGWKFLPILPWMEISGWLTPAEAMSLYTNGLKVAGEGVVFAEIGSWQGKSSFVLAKSLSKFQGTKLFCMDPFSAESDDESVLIKEFREDPKNANMSLRDAFNRNMKQYGVDHVVHVLQGFSYDFAGDFKEELSFLMIDGDHSYEGVMKDITLWSGFIKVGGFMAFHDSDWKGVDQAIEEAVVASDEWQECERADSLRTFQRVKK